MSNNFDCTIIGSGPGGYVAAIRAAQHNLKVALIESSNVGGTCLNRGCIPSKALITSADILRKVNKASNYGVNIENFSFDYAKMLKRKNDIVSTLRRGVEGLIKSNKITFLSGYGKLVSTNEIKIIGQDEGIMESKSIILATGTEPLPFPNVPFSSRILNSTSLLDLPTLPKNLGIIGGGVIGCEFASLFHTLGVEISIIEAAPSLISQEATALSSFLTNSFKKCGISIFTNSFITKISEQEDKVIVSLKNGTDLEFEKVLISIGRAVNTQNINLEKIGVLTNDKGFVQVNERMQTTIPNIYAIGDITGQSMLAHVASHQGLVAADVIAGKHSHMDYTAIPSVIFTHPEIASVGLTPEKAKSMFPNVEVSSFPFQALGKALSLSATEGFAQIVYLKDSQKIIGAQIAGEHASSLIAEMTIAIKNELTLPCIYETIHAHPTLAEAWLESALLADGHPLHLPPKNR